MSTPDYENMSDEEFMNQAPPEVEFDEDGGDKEPDAISLGDSSDSDDFGLDDEEERDSDSNDNDLDEDEEENDDLENQDDEEEDDDPDSDEGEEDEEDTSDGDEEEKEKEKSQPNDEELLQYKADMEKLLSPFRANSGEMSVKSVDEARTLMQQGANYTKKMQQIKPNLKIIKKLGNNDLLDEDKLDLMIEAAAGKPEAISKLLAQHSIDPFSLNTDNVDSYTPEVKQVTDSEMELDEVLDDLQDSPSITRTLETVNKKWDKESRGIVASSPGNLRVIHDHIEAGLYDVIAGEVNRRQALGQFKGEPFIGVYQQVGEELKNSGQLDKFFQSEESPAPKKTPSKPSGKRDDSEAREKRKRASSQGSNRSGKSGKSKPQQKAIWEMSDAEFEEAMNSGKL